jgi:hypothetical protein
VAAKKKSRITGDTEIGQMALSIFGKVRDIKRANPAISRKIDRMEAEIRERLEIIRGEIARLDKRDRDLVTILVINGIHRSTEEVLVH